jgi:hypothetical protein
MWNADMPRVREIGGELGGQKFGVKLDDAQDKHLHALTAEVAELGRVQKLQGNALRSLVSHTIRKEGER